MKVYDIVAGRDEFAPKLVSHSGSGIAVGFPRKAPVQIPAIWEVTNHPPISWEIDDGNYPNCPGQSAGINHPVWTHEVGAAEVS